MIPIKFTHNYNNKLLCPNFTTIRLRNDAKYKVGEFYDIYYQCRDAITENYLGPARVLDIRHFRITELSVFMSHIDMGRHPIDGRIELMGFWENERIDWNTQQLSFILLEQQETGIRSIIPDRIKLKQPEINLFTTIPVGYETKKLVKE